MKKHKVTKTESIKSRTKTKAEENLFVEILIFHFMDQNALARFPNE